MRTYRTENLTPKEKQLLADLLSEDLAEVKEWLKMAADDYEGATSYIVAAREEIEEKEPIVEYLRGELENPREWYLIGYLTAYIRAKEKLLNAEIEANLQDYLKAAKEKDEAFIKRMNRKAEQLAQLRRILGGGYVQDPPEWEEDLEA